MRNKSEILNKRQESVLKILEKRGRLGISEVLGELKIIFENLSKITVNRDLKRLAESGYITAKGKARAVTYELSLRYNKKELERLTIELSWKSSRIEGNTYTLLETESLIVEGKEAIMILNHKKTLDYIVKNKDIFRKMTTSKIEDIHYLLTKDLGVTRNLRKTAVGIVGTKYMPLDNQHQIREAMEKICDVVNAENNVFAKAIILSILIAYIQPFEDGNKRTSRLIANAILLAYNICPLSYRAVILFYEQNNLSYFKELFIEQFEFAVNNYFKA